MTLTESTAVRPFADVVAREIFFYFLVILRLLEEIVDDFGEPVSEAYEVRAAFARVDAVDEGEHGFVVTVVVLNADFDLDLVPKA
jgi:hypothetical protein